MLRGIGSTNQNVSMPRQTTVGAGSLLPGVTHCNGTGWLARVVATAT